MGVTLNPKAVIVCSKCETHLTNIEDITSKKFTMKTADGDTTVGWLSQKMYNVVHGERMRTIFSTGEHIIRSASCKGCNQKLGWLYEFAYEQSELFKTKNLHRTTMGVVFKPKTRELKYIICSNCHLFITTLAHFTSKHFRMMNSNGNTVRGYLFKKVENVVHGETIKTAFSTGEHIIRNVSCSGCDKFLGWYYEFAYEQSEVYKESQTLLSSTDVNHYAPLIHGPLELENDSNDV